MFLILILALVLTALTGIFILQNAFPVTVTFLVWKFEGSLVLLLSLAFALGIIVALLMFLALTLRKRKHSSGRESGI
ncbi:MAG: LapA family protein [Deltaproteobacteria bacterium]|nr:LapA family protein [Deltaproteobacteria bacterium]MBI2349678.1 LapA family protein [Deltaproteobacteria bacterium]